MLVSTTEASLPESSEGVDCNSDTSSGDALLLSSSSIGPQSPAPSLRPHETADDVAAPIAATPSVDKYRASAPHCRMQTREAGEAGKTCG